MKHKLSIIVPCFHSERSLPVLMEAIVAESSWLNGYDYEVILVNDGSGLATWEAITALTEKYPFCREIDLARNCGQHNANLAGIHRWTEYANPSAHSTKGNGAWSHER